MYLGARLGLFIFSVYRGEKCSHQHSLKKSSLTKQLDKASTVEPNAIECGN